MSVAPGTGRRSSTWRSRRAAAARRPAALVDGVSSSVREEVVDVYVQAVATHRAAHVREPLAEAYLISA